jgi:hypothetical protein
MNRIVVVAALLLLSVNCVIASDRVFEGTYHSDKDAGEKIVITKTGDKTYSIVNKSGKWTALAAKGIGGDDGAMFDYYKGVISWPKGERENVGYINMTLRKDGKSILAIHRWNFWKDEKNGADPWEETWVKE